MQATVDPFTMEEYREARHLKFLLKEIEDGNKHTGRFVKEAWDWLNYFDQEMSTHWKHHKRLTGCLEGRNFTIQRLKSEIVMLKKEIKHLKKGRKVKGKVGMKGTKATGKKAAGKARGGGSSTRRNVKKEQSSDSSWSSAEEYQSECWSSDELGEKEFVGKTPHD